jgi:outer membrane protease
MTRKFARPALALFFSITALRFSFAEGRLSLSLESGFGLLYGSAREIVYDGGYMLSELVWPSEPLIYGGLRLGIKSPGGFVARLDVKAGLPGPVGTITDSDYLNYDGVKTHFSAHNCSAERAILLDAKAGWAFPLSRAFSLSLMAAFSTMNFKWSAKDGYMQYPSEDLAPYTPWSSSAPKTAVYGTGIIYEQTYFIPGLFLGIDGSLSSSLELRGGFFYSPYVICDDVDNHEFTGADYYEHMSGGSLVEPSLEAEWRIGPELSLTIDIGYRYIWALLGDATLICTTSSPFLSRYSPGATSTSTNGGGASYSALDVSLRFSARL